VRRWLARWRVALRIARRDAGRHRGRTALVVAMIALPILAGTVALTAIRSVTPTPEQQIATRLGPGGQAEVTPAGCRPYYQDPSGVSGGCEQGESAPIDTASLRTVLGVEDVAAITHVVAVLVGPDGALPDRAVTETQDPDHLHELVEVVDGRAPDEPGEVALTRGIAARLGVTIGDTLVLEAASGDADAVVVGLLHASSRTPAVAVTGTTPGNGQVEATRWIVLGDSVTWDQVLLANAQGWQVFSRQVVLDPPPLSATP
jgi:putative ABC transport system permease protein